MKDARIWLTQHKLCACWGAYGTTHNETSGQGHTLWYSDNDLLLKLYSSWEMIAHGVKVHFITIKDKMQTYVFRYEDHVQSVSARNFAVKSLHQSSKIKEDVYCEMLKKLHLQSRINNMACLLRVFSWFMVMLKHCCLNAIWPSAGNNLRIPLQLRFFIKRSSCSNIWNPSLLVSESSGNIWFASQVLSFYDKGYNTLYLAL